MACEKRDQTVGIRAVSEGCDSKEPLILVAEDIDSDYRLLEILLRAFQLHRAVNGVEAVLQCEILRPDLILMDIRMPFMDGIEAIRQIRQTGSDVPIIVVTACAFKEDKRVAFSAGCSDYITKPLSFVELKEKLAVALANR